MRDLPELDPAEIAPVVNTNIAGLMDGLLTALKGNAGAGAGGHIYNMYGHGSNDQKVSGSHIYGATKRAVRYFTEALIQVKCRRYAGQSRFSQPRHSRNGFPDQRHARDGARQA